MWTKWFVTTIYRYNMPIGLNIVREMTWKLIVLTRYKLNLFDLTSQNKVYK